MDTVSLALLAMLGVGSLVSLWTMRTAQALQRSRRAAAVARRRQPR
jgi:hypothetical protein